MTNDQIKSVLNTLIGERENEIAAFQSLLTLLENGFQSDKKAIAESIAGTLAPVITAVARAQEAITAAQPALVAEPMTIA